MRFLFIFLLLSFSFPALSQNDPAGFSPPQTEEELAAFIKNAEAIYNSPDFMEKLSAHPLFPKIDQQKIKEQGDTYASANKKLLRHIKASEGQVFKTFHEHILLNKDKVNTYAEQLKKIMADKEGRYQRINQQQEQQIKQIRENKPLELCKTSKTEIVVESEGSSKTEEAFSDMLFVPTDFVIEDEKESYGETATVFYISPQELDNEGYFTAKAFGTDCLPSRYIMTNQRLYKHSGVAALKNYSKSFKSGKLHEYAKKLANRLQP